MHDPQIPNFHFANLEKGSFLTITLFPPFIFWSEDTDRVPIKCDLPHYKWLHRSRLQSRQMNNIKAGWRRKADVVFRVRTRDLAIQDGLWLHLQSTTLTSLFPSCPAPWCSGCLVECIQVPEAVAFVESGGLQTSPCTSYSSKQQRPTAWVTARR